LKRKKKGDKAQWTYVEKCSPHSKNTPERFINKLANPTAQLAKKLKNGDSRANQ